jgi:DNA mismatch repair ATPase MutS
VPRSFQLDNSKKRRSISATTIELRQINDRISGSLNEIFLVTDALLRDELLDLVTDLGCIYKLREVTSTLDMLCSFAEVCLLPSFACMSQEVHIRIERGFDGALEHLVWMRLNSPSAHTASTSIVTRCHKLNFR